MASKKNTVAPAEPYDEMKYHAESMVRDAYSKSPEFKKRVAEAYRQLKTMQRSMSRFKS